MPGSEFSLKALFFYLFPGNSKTFNPADSGDPRLLNPQQVGKQIQEERSGPGHHEEREGGNFPGLWQHQMSFNYSSLFVVLDKSFHEFPKNNTLAIGSFSVKSSGREQEGNLQRKIFAPSPRQ